MNLTKQDEGKVVYFVKHDYIIGAYYVCYGIIDCVFEYDKKVVVDYLRFPDTRHINGIHIRMFEETRWMKLPKEWADPDHRSNVLYEEDFRTHDYYWDRRVRELDWRNPDSIKKAYENGLFVLMRDSHEHLYKIETEIDKYKGYRVVKKAKSMYEYEPTHNTYDFDKIYATYEEAKAVADVERAELERQARLTDEEWSIEQIQKTLNHWQNCYNVTDEEKKRMFDEIMTFKNIEDIETRMLGGVIQWKYWKNKKWNNIILD